MLLDLVYGFLLQLVLQPGMLHLAEYWKVSGKKVHGVVPQSASRNTYSFHMEVAS